MTESSSPQSAKPTTSQRKKARKLVMQALYQRHISGDSIAEIEAQFRVDNDFSKVDQAYFSELFQNIPKQFEKIDAKISPLLDRNVEDVDPIEIALLRIGVYEFLNRIDVPYRVVINEAVDLAKQFGGTDGHKYVNSILDKLSLSLRPAETRRKSE